MTKTTQPRERPSVFVGSSTEGISVAKAIQLGLDQSCEVELWSQGAFGLSEGTLESLVASANRFDFAVLVLSADDLMVSRGELRASPRDNVLFELGLFIGRLGRERTFVVYDRANPPKLPSDLAGITAATFQPHGSGNIEAAVGAACTRIEQAISRLGPRAGTGLSRLSQATQTFQDLSSDAQQLLRLLARSRAVELDIIAEQFGAFIEPDKLNLIRRDLVDLEEKVSKRSFEELSELARELLSAAASTGSIYVLQAEQLLYPLITAGETTFGGENDPQAQAGYWAALKKLQELGLIEHVDGSLYRLTALGFSSAKALSDANGSG